MVEFGFVAVVEFGFVAVVELGSLLWGLLLW